MEWWFFVFGILIGLAGEAIAFLIWLLGFSDHNAAFRGPDPWSAAMRFSKRLRERERRERGSRR